ncbi:MAG: LamG-like jellyroll fold domain-containing protein [Myxococcota bacterium]
MIALFCLFACRNDTTIKTFNDPPTVDITSHQAEDVLVEGQTVDFIAAPADSNHAIDELEVEWHINGTVMCPRALAINNQSICAVTIPEGPLEIRATVYDPQNASGEDSIELAVIPSEAPFGTILEPISETRYYSDELIPFAATVSDAEDSPDSLVIEWESTIDGTLSISSTADSSGNYADFTNLSEGNHGVTLRVTDSSIKTSQTTATITVGPPNTPPTCSIVSPIDNSMGILGESITLESQVDDADVGPENLSIVWSSDLDGELCSDSAESTGAQKCEVTIQSAGTHQLNLRVEDERGLSCIQNTEITVSSPPQITILTPSQGTVINENSSITVELQITDPEDPPSSLTLTATDSIEGELVVTQPDSQGYSSLSLNNWSIGDHELVFTALDTDGLEHSQSLLITVNGLPNAPSLSFSPTPVYTSDSLQVLAAGSIDPEGQVLTANYQWLQEGQSTSFTTDTIPASATSKGELWTAIVTMLDGYGNSPSSSLSTTIQNSPPVIATINIAPSSGVSTSSVLACAAAATDADGDSLNSTYEWFGSNGAVLGTGASLNLSPSLVQPDDSINCTVTVDDGDGGLDSDSASVVVINSLPTVLSLEITPDPATTADSLLAITVSEDLDNQPVTLSYDWTVNGISHSTSHTLSNAFFQRGDLIALTVTPNDGIDDGPSLGTNLTVANSPPSAPSIEISPEDPIEGLDDLVCSVIVDSTDVDNDAVSYSYGWTVDGQMTSYASDVISAGLTLAGETWTCTVTPNDGFDNGMTASHSVDIRSDCSSLELDGSDDGLRIAEQDNLLGITTNFSIGAWIYLDSAYNQSGMAIFDGESTNSSDGPRNSGYGLRVQEGQLTIFVGTGTQSNMWWQSGIPLPTDQWVHVAGVRSSNVISLYVNGQMIFEDNTIPIAPINFDGLDYDHNRYQIGLLDPNGIGGPHFDFMGRIRHVGVWARALSSGEITQLSTVDFDSTLFGLVGHWPINEGIGQIALETTSGIDASFEGNPTWVESCPFQDDDNDGYNAMQDCDDNDPTVYTPDGSSASCAALSCKWIENSGYAQGNGIYWLDPDGTGAFEAYCDMNTDGGGWTLILKAVNDNFEYDDPIWTSDNTLNPTDFQLTGAGVAKYPAFNSVAFTEIRTSDIAAFSIDFTHQFNSNYSSALELFSGSGIPINNGLQAYFNNMANPLNQSWGCSQFQRFGFNQLDYLGVADVGGGAYCDWNGGARWGQRINANHNGAGNHSGQGWGAYSTVCPPYRSVSNADPLCAQGIFEISQLLWIR